MKQQLTLLEQFCATTGLAVHPKKCHGFMLEDGAVDKDRGWRLEGTPIPMVDSGQSIRYLGIQGGPDKGVVAPDLVPTMMGWLDNISHACLKPSQKIRLLMMYTLPRITYQATLGKVAVTGLMAVDRLIRKRVKEWLHLAQSTSNGLLYSRIRDGGLGITRLEKAIPGIRMRCIWKMCSSEDNWARAVAREAVSLPNWQAM